MIGARDRFFCIHPVYLPACVCWPVSMAGAIPISLSSHFFGPESHLQAAEILLLGLFSVVHLSSQHIRQR